MRGTFKEALYGSAHLWCPRGAADQNHFINFSRLQLGVGERQLDGNHGAVNDGANQRVESPTRELVREYFSIGQREFEYRGFFFRELMLHVDQSFAQFLCQFAMRGKIDFFGLQDFFMDEGLQKIVDIVAAEVSVAIRCENLVNVAVVGGDQFQNGNIKCAATEIVHSDFSALLFMQTIGECRGSWLVHKAQNFQSGNFPGVFGGLTLGVVEISRHGNDRAIDWLAEECFRPIIQLAQNERRNFRRGKNLATEANANHVAAGRIEPKRKKLQLVLNVFYAAAHQ